MTTTTTTTATPARRELRALQAAALLCAVGAGLALLALHRDWQVEQVLRPAPLPPEEVTRTGVRLAAWAAAAGWLALAGTGALVATRGRLRQLVGVLVAVAGVVMVATAVRFVFDPAVSTLWPVVCGLGGLAVVASGGWTVARGRGWPAMGARYERPAARGVADRPAGRSSHQSLWEALDRGEDPTTDESGSSGSQSGAPGSR